MPTIAEAVRPLPLPPPPRWVEDHLADFVADLQAAGVAISPMAVLARATDLGMPSSVVAQIARTLGLRSPA